MFFFLQQICNDLISAKRLDLIKLLLGEGVTSFDDRPEFITKVDALVFAFVVKLLKALLRVAHQVVIATIK